MEQDPLSAGRGARPRGGGKGPQSAWVAAAAPAVRCIVPGCGQQTDPSRLMCRGDWSIVPKQLRDRVWITWRSGRPLFPGEHRAAASAAIAAVLAFRRNDQVTTLADGRDHESRPPQCPCYPAAHSSGGT